MKKILVVFLLAITPALFIGKSYAQKPEVVTSNKAGWQKIGETTADFKTEKDQIMVMGADRFKALKLKVTDSPIHIASMAVMYESGDAEDIVLKNDLKAGGESRVINLKGTDRAIKSVNFVYKTVGNEKKEGKAHVELWGLK